MDQWIRHVHRALFILDDHDVDIACSARRARYLAHNGRRTLTHYIINLLRTFTRSDRHPTRYSAITSKPYYC